MAEEEFQEEEEEKEEKVKPTLLGRIFSTTFIERVLSEALRLIIFAIVAFFIAYQINQRSTGTVIGQQSGQLGDTNAAGNIITRPLGVEWSMEEMIINTSDELDNHFVKAVVVISCEPTNPELISELEQRSGEIHSEVREIIGSKSYLDIKRIDQQDLLSQEIKTRIQRIIGKSGIIDVFLKEFSVH